MTPADDVVTVVREPTPGEQLQFVPAVVSGEPGCPGRMELVSSAGELVAHAYWGATLCRWASERALPEPTYEGGRPC